MRQQHEDLKTWEREWPVMNAPCDITQELCFSTKLSEKYGKQRTWRLFSVLRDSLLGWILVLLLEYIGHHHHHGQSKTSWWYQSWQGELRPLQQQAAQLGEESDQDAMKDWTLYEKKEKKVEIEDRATFISTWKREGLTVNPVNPFGFSDMDREQNWQ